MAIRLTKTEIKLLELMCQIDLQEVKVYGAGVALRGFGKTTLAANHYMYVVNEVLNLETKAEKLQSKVESIVDNRNRRIREKEQAKLNKLAQKEAAPFHKWLGANNGKIN